MKDRPTFQQSQIQGHIEWSAFLLNLNLSGRTNWFSGAWRREWKLRKKLNWTFWVNILHLMSEWIPKSSVEGGGAGLNTRSSIRHKVISLTTFPMTWTWWPQTHKSTTPLNLTESDLNARRSIDGDRAYPRKTGREHSSLNEQSDCRELSWTK